MADPATLLAAEQVISTTVQGGAVAAYGTSPTHDGPQVLLDVVSLHWSPVVSLIYQALLKRPNRSPQPSPVSRPLLSFHVPIIL